MSLLVRTTFESLRLLTPVGVYAPRSDTALLASEIGAVHNAEVLELCTGSGAVALTAAKRGARRVVASDLSRRAMTSVRLNARLNRSHVEVRRGDLFAVAHAGERFDVVLANPPYLPAAADEAPDDRWDAGPDGRLIIDRIIDGVRDALKPEGRLVMVQSALASIDATPERLTKNKLEVIRCVEHVGPLGPIATARQEHLIRIGAIDRGGQLETLVAFTARPIS